MKRYYIAIVWIFNTLFLYFLKSLKTPLPTLALEDLLEFIYTYCSYSFVTTTTTWVCKFCFTAGPLSTDCVNAFSQSYFSKILDSRILKDIAWISISLSVIIPFPVF